MVSRTLARLVAFDAARRQGDTLAVRLALPDLPARRLSRLSHSARFAHERFAHGASAVTVTSAPAPSCGGGRTVIGGERRAEVGEF